MKKYLEPFIKKTQWGFEVWTIGPREIFDTLYKAEAFSKELRETEMMFQPNAEKML